jgi:tRNA(fMet)-specific endonuclease VapC
VDLYEQQVLPRLTVLPFDLNCARVYAKVRAELSFRGQNVDDADLMIAATALHHNLCVVTANRRHFDRVPKALQEPGGSTHSPGRSISGVR